MSEPDPIPLLESRLEEYKRDLQKSVSLYNEGKIDAETHLTHKTNLNRLIMNYGEALTLLKIAEMNNVFSLGCSLEEIINMVKDNGKKTQSA